MKPHLKSVFMICIIRMRTLGFVALAVFCFATLALADPPNPSKEQLAALEKLLNDSELEESDSEFDDETDSLTRKWNPITWIKNKLKNKCKCEDSKCDCCFKLKLLKDTVCFSAEQLSEEKALQIIFKMNEKELVNRKFNINRNDQLCGKVPGLPFVKFCFTQQSEEEDDKTITSCSSVDFRVGGTVGAVLQLRCLQLKDGTISFGGFKKVEKSNALVVKVKNPFRAAIALYEKSLG